MGRNKCSFDGKRWNSARSWAYLGPFWAMLGHFGPCWHHIGLMLGHFRLFSDMCRPLCWTWHFNVVEFSSMRGVCKKHPKYEEQIQFVDCVADGFCCYFFVFVSFLGHAAVRLCLPDLGLMLGHCGLCRHHIGLMLGNCVVFCGLRLPLLSHFKGILWFVLAFVGQELGPYSAYLGPFWIFGSTGIFGQWVGFVNVKV